MTVSEYLEYGNFEEDVKSLLNKIRGFYNPEFVVISDALWQMYKQGAFDAREKIIEKLEKAVIEVAGNSAATMDQAIRIVRDLND
jgi:hypothetical protein